MTAQIVAFNVTQYAMLPIAIGFGMIFFGKTENMKLGFATVLTLIIVPVLYTMFHGIRYRPLQEMG